MKFAFLSFIGGFLGTETLRKIAVLILREVLALSLVSLAILFSLESLLPGTVSLRNGIVFFILGISGALLIERSLARTLPLVQIRPSHAPTSRKTRLLFGGFILWSGFLLGNALFGFHPLIILLILLITIPLLALLFDMAFGGSSEGLGKGL